MGETKVRKQHYVWRKYLEAWATDGSVWCRRGSATFNTGLMNIGQERDFYSPQPLTNADKQFLRMDAASTKRPDLVEFIEQEIALRDEMFALNEQAKQWRDISRLEELEAFIHNSEEKYQGRIEHQGMPFVNALVAGDITWAGNDKEWRKFILFYATQYLRTKRIQEKLKNFLEPQAQRIGYSVDRTWPISRLLETERLASGIYHHCSLVLLETSGTLEFITGDQPTFNAEAVETYSLDNIPNSHELYYPVSPNRAVLLVEEERRSAPLIRVATEAEVLRYNEVIRRVALEQVYARTRELL
ncbi:DUF4238 domain-containing protein [Stigmatella erecta]|uniref:DUF4238 domain-containing protein n=1 Tax=Stigmatella erecta TaxID=83460 RepID=A0A1I0K9U0_9BACT|nr:DUF4238 domain-containing protein [Stigmatella erecta]SEU20064.1 Protein of unknown function [Stigmatella erecta]